MSSSSDVVAVRDLRHFMRFARLYSRNRSWILMIRSGRSKCLFWEEKKNIKISIFDASYYTYLVFDLGKNHIF